MRALSVAVQPCVAASSTHHRRSTAVQRRRQLRRARAEPWNEGAAQVRRLVDRDRKELDLDELESAFAEDPSTSDAAAAAAAAEAAAAAAAVQSSFQVNSSQADKTPVSPFGPSSSGNGGSSPFGGSGAAAKRPFSEPAGLSPNMPTPLKDTAPWWSKITLTQVVIVLSFTTIIGIMIGTFFFVLSTGAIRFNDQ